MCTRKGHLEAIEQIRQMMAEEKYFEAQKIIEVQLKINSVDRYSFLKLYFESLSYQKKVLPPELQIELAEKSLENQDKKLASELIQNNISERYFTRSSKIKLKILQENGNIDEIHKVISEFLLRQFEFQIPVVPHWLIQYSEKYFKNDFAINLKIFSINLLRNDLLRSEEILKKIIITTVESSTFKGGNEKIQMMGQVLSGVSNKGRLEIYQNFCSIFCEGIKEKSDYKKIIEMIIFFDEFKFQVLVLKLLMKLKLDEIAGEYVSTIRLNKEYTFVYIDKYYPNLKKIFHQVKVTEKVSAKNDEIPDLQLTEKIRSEILSPLEEIESNTEEEHYNNILKYQNFNGNQLCDLSVSFIQSQMPRVALNASQAAMNVATDDKEFLKACYLKLTCQMLIGDFRAAIDTSITALERAKSQEDILSFLYGKAEAYIRLNLKDDAKRVLRGILTIDAKYRLAKERLDKLNEI